MKQYFIDFVGLLGFGSLCYGLSLVALELTFIVGGSLLMCYSIKASEDGVSKGDI